MPNTGNSGAEKNWEEIIPQIEGAKTTPRYAHQPNLEEDADPDLDPEGDTSPQHGRPGPSMKRNNQRIAYLKNMLVEMHGNNTASAITARTGIIREMRMVMNDMREAQITELKLKNRQLAHQLREIGGGAAITVKS
jgi:hypothetical protein